jgi:hypothetical protein
VRYRALQSEEGGRFFLEDNLNLVIEADESFPQTEPRDCIWMTLRQLKQFVQYNNFVNAQARCLLSCLGLLDMPANAAEPPAPDGFAAARHGVDAWEQEPRKLEPLATMGAPS